MTVPEVARISIPPMEAMWESTDGLRRKKRTKGFDGEMELVAQAPSGPLHSTEGACATLPSPLFSFPSDPEATLNSALL